MKKCYKKSVSLFSIHPLILIKTVGVTITRKR